MKQTYERFEELSETEPMIKVTAAEYRRLRLLEAEFNGFYGAVKMFLDAGLSVTAKPEDVERIFQQWRTDNRPPAS